MKKRMRVLQLDGNKKWFPIIDIQDKPGGLWVSEFYGQQHDLRSEAVAEGRELLRRVKLLPQPTPGGR